MVALLVGFILGSILGSFSKATSDRLIKKEKIGGRSYCQECKKTLAWYDLFPIISYLVLGGKCRYCQHKIPLEVWLVELAVGGLVALIFFLYPFQNLSFINLYSLGSLSVLLGLGFSCFVVVVLTILFLTDLETGFLPDKVTIPAIIISLFYLLISSLLKAGIFYQSFKKSPLAPYLMFPKSDYLYQHISRIFEPVAWDLGVALLLAGLFLLIIIVTRGRGMGGGDVKYIFFLGLALGFPAILVGVFLAFLIGSIVSVTLIIVGKKHFGQTVPFGPFLSIGSYIGLLFGNQIINWYINNFRI